MNFGMFYFLFLKIVNMSITASFVILFVLITRFLIKKLPRIFSYILWSAVLFRLICPFSFSLPFSLLDLTTAKSVENGMVVYVPTDIINLGKPAAAMEETSNAADAAVAYGTPEHLTAEAAMETAVIIMVYVWIAGILGVGGCSIISFIRLKKRLVGAVKCEENVWMSDYVKASFVMGIFHPAIYLWSGLTEKEREFVIVHEQTHIERCDHLVKLLFYLALILHWFNPLVWLSYFLCMKDMEMSCDESVMKKMGREIRADYSESLLSLATGRKIFAGTPLFFGEGDTKSRIKNVLNYKRPSAWAITAGVIVVAVLCIGFIGNPSEDAGDSENSVKIVESTTGIFEVRYPEIQFPSQTMNPFTVRLSLPSGWVLGKRDLGAEDIANLNVKEVIGAFLTTYIFDEEGICVGKLGCNYYELYEGAEDNPQAIYNQVALGNHYQFDVRNTYEIIRSNDMIETGMADVLYSELANDGGNTTSNYGILSRSKESLVYVALELEKNLISKETAAIIAESISFDITGDNQNFQTEGSNPSNEIANGQTVWYADLTGDGEEEIITVDSRGWDEEMLVELYVHTQDGTLLWNEEGAYAHMGWNTVFLINISGRDYLLTYHPYMSTGAASYQYEIFGLKKGTANQNEVYAEGSVSFLRMLMDFETVEEAFNIDKMAAFADEINGYLSSSALLFSTEEGELKIGKNMGRNEDGSLIVNHNISESYSFCDGELAEIQIPDGKSIDELELREKLRIYLEECLVILGRDYKYY